MYKFLSSEICSLVITRALTITWSSFTTRGADSIVCGAVAGHAVVLLLLLQVHRLLWGLVCVSLVTLLMLMVMMMVMVTSLGRVRGVEVVVGVVGVVQGRLPTYLGLFRRTTKTRKARCLNIRIIVIPIIPEFHLTPEQPTPSSRLFSPSSSSSTCGSKA